MKTIVIIIALAIVVAISAVITKPSDERCIQLAKNEAYTAVADNTENSLIKTGLSLLLDVGVNKVFFRVEDKLFYKEVYIKGGDAKLGTVVFGSFFVSDTIKEGIK